MRCGPQGIGNEEFFFDFDPPGSDEVISRFISDEFRVPAEAMIAQVERLRDRYRGGEPAANGGGGSGKAAAKRMPMNTAEVTKADMELFLAAARSLQIERPEITPVWPFLVQAIECNWLGPANIDHAIETTRLFDFDPPGSDPLIVSFVSDAFRVPAEAMVAELERLRDRDRGG